MRASKEDWINEGLRILYGSGPEALVIKELCKGLSLTKGSFYHHFSGREDYCSKLLEYWKNKSTLEVIRISSKKENPKDALARLTVLTRNIGSNPERAIRAWSFRDPVAAKAQKEVDEWRINYLKKLLSETYPEKKAELKAKIIHSIFLSYTLAFSSITKKELIKIYEDIVPETYNKKSRSFR
ncbi:TetR/AcrR family transcriptional regulator [Leptospira sarikeiensis]|uniref:TetR/AcrR family transcriptional regulator n=1 Tax=Leptospira sarikeiensis TaxID=2484943 RepID=UPI0014383DA0|nr:TetR/AcrR family transcriptional regulator [Leptospira sarikeiensis]